MILHFIPVEKFVNRAISIFEEAFPNQNRFYVFSYDTNEQFLDILDTNDSEKIIIVKHDEKWWRKDFIKVKENDVLFFHNLYSPANIFYAHNKSLKNKRHAAIWGYDFYGETKFWPKSQFGKLTLIKAKSGLNHPNKFKKIIYYINRINELFLSKVRGINKPSLRNKTIAFYNIDTIQTHVKEDFFNVKKKFNEAYKWSNFSYYTYEDYHINNEVELNENKIQIGNSATYSNNHLEVFTLLEQLQVKAEIFCPLNYGNENYAKCIEEEGNRIFGSNFKALLEFLPLQDYNNLQASCGIVIMNHYRQQGAGNIICALINGSKVFLSINSPLYKHFKSLGLYIFCLEEDLKNKKDLKLLTYHEIKTNKDILQSYYSRQNIINALKASIAL